MSLTGDSAAPTAATTRKSTAIATATSRALTRGRRTGVQVPPVPNYDTEDMLEDPDELFKGAQLGLDANNAGDSDENDPVAESDGKKPKKQLRFSLENSKGDTGEEDGPNEGDKASGISVAARLRANHPAKQLVQTAAGGVGRESWDPEVSSVSTAAPSVRDDVPDDGDDDTVELPRSETEPDTTSVSEQQGSSPGLLDSVSNQEGNEDDDDDDLIPPAPPEYPDHEDDDDDEEDVEEAKEPDASVDQTKGRKSASPKDDRVNDSFDNDDKEGDGFDMHDDGDDDQLSDEPETPASVKEKRRRKEERLKLLANKNKATKQSVKAKPSKKRKVVDDDETESESEKTPAPKPRKKPAKKFNRFATTFSPKGMPLPRTMVTVPVSDYKTNTPDDKDVRRSKRARTKPLEFWRGEKVQYGPNDFGDDYDGVTNMPIVVGFAKAGPTPYKKRKAPPQKKKVNEPLAKKSKSAGDDIDAMEPLDPSTLRVGYDFNPTKNAAVWDERYQESRDMSTLHLCKSSCTKRSGLILILSSFYAQRLLPTIAQ
jgi:centromere protein C